MIIDWKVYPWHGAQSFTLGHIFNWVSRELSLEGRTLFVKVITSQYRNIKATTSQYRNIKATTSQYRNIKATTSQYRKVKVTTSGG